MPPPARARRGAHAGRAGGARNLTTPPSPATGHRATRLDPDLRRGLIVDAAERLLAEHDPLTATFEDVARTAGVSRPLVHAYVGDRRGLVDAVQVRIVGRLDRWVDHGLRRAPDRRGRLRALVDGTFAFVGAERDAWGVLAATGGLDHPALHQVRARWSALVAVDGDGDDPAAQAVVAGLLLGVGPWVARAVEPTEVLPAFAAAVALTEPSA